MSDIPEKTVDVAMQELESLLSAEANIEQKIASSLQKVGKL